MSVNNSAGARSGAFNRGGNFTHAEDELIRRGVADGWTYATIGAEIGRAARSVQSRAGRIGIKTSMKGIILTARRCLLCRVEFTFDRAASNFFMCDSHRNPA